ncbi:anti-repressor SinI family protein [Thalassobacillus hwangdonensis]|uniref:Anti-repressor SinI family protein n=1 Tax=Thalassobacillus hwangdonensis TaxID=546108 RepID=A0ABW3L4T6_9BACI
MMNSNKQCDQLDEEWVALMKIAKSVGFKKEEVAQFINKGRVAVENGK